MDSDIRATKNCLYIEQDNNIVPINLNDVVRIWLSDDSDLSWATGYGPLYFIEVLILDRVHRQIKHVGPLIIREEEMISDMREVLSSRFFSVEILEGTFHFYNSSFDWKPDEKVSGLFKGYRNDIGSHIEIRIDYDELQQFLAAKEEYLKQKEKPYE